MPFNLSTEARDAACTAIVELIDVDTPGEVHIYDSTGDGQPASPQVAVSTQVKLAGLVFSATAFGAASTGVCTANDFTPDTSVVGGTATWARVYNGGTVDPEDAVFDMDIGQDSGTLDFDNITFVTDGTADITSMTITVPEA